MTFFGLYAGLCPEGRAVQQTQAESKSFWQKVFDNNYLLLALGIAFPGIFYFGWGVLEILVFNNIQLSDYLSRVGLDYLK